MGCVRPWSWAGRECACRACFWELLGRQWLSWKHQPSLEHLWLQRGRVYHIPFPTAPLCLAFLMAEPHHPCSPPTLLGCCSRSTELLSLDNPDPVFSGALGGSAFKECCVPAKLLCQPEQHLGSRNPFRNLCVSRRPLPLPAWPWLWQDWAVPARNATKNILCQAGLVRVGKP